MFQTFGIHHLAILSLLMAPPLAVAAPPPRAPGKAFPPLDEILLDPKLHQLPLVKLLDVYKREASAADQALYKSRQAALKERGIDLPEQDPSGFHWMSSAKEGLRSNPKCLQFLGKTVGEVLVRGNDDKVGPVTVSIYNRGDDGAISTKELASRMSEWKSLLDEKLGVRAEARADKSAVSLEGWMWQRGTVAWLLESSVNKSNKGEAERAEFLRLRIASLDAINVRSTQSVHRLALRDNLVHKPNGDTYIENMPMVDQGQKGYCAVATFERVARYYGLEVDQHEMAQVVNTSARGTDSESMENAFKKLTGIIHVRTTKHIENSMKQFQQDVAAYNQAAKKEKKPEFHYKRGESIVHPAVFAATADTALFTRIKAKQQEFGRFNSKIEEYINQGIPICWALQLGMFKEEGIPQTQGGHMRLIIGYNEKTSEIIYTDSWGKGHEFKRMPAVNAWCMTTAIYTMAPTR